MGGYPEADSLLKNNFRYTHYELARELGVDGNSTFPAPLHPRHRRGGDYIMDITAQATTLFEKLKNNRSHFIRKSAEAEFGRAIDQALPMASRLDAVDTLRVLVDEAKYSLYRHL